MPRFNPLTGISSILTQSSCSDAERRSPTFQSPDGDFVYSDGGSVPRCGWGLGVFQSPDGDFVYSDPGLWV